MVVSFSTNCFSLGFIAPSPRSKLSLPQSLHLQSDTDTRSKSSIRFRFSANRHISHSSPPSSGTTLLEDQSQSQSEENEADSSTEVAPELKQVQREKGDKEQQWFELGKMLGTAGVVLAVIAASMAALLSVNAILAELSDKVFDGKIRIQDFF